MSKNRWGYSAARFFSLSLCNGSSRRALCLASALAPGSFKICSFFAMSASIRWTLWAFKSISRTTSSSAAFSFAGGTGCTFSTLAGGGGFCLSFAISSGGAGSSSGSTSDDCCPMAQFACPKKMQMNNITLDMTSHGATLSVLETFMNFTFLKIAFAVGGDTLNSLYKKMGGNLCFQ